MRKLSLFMVIMVLTSFVLSCGGASKPVVQKRTDLNLSTATTLTSIDPHFSERITDMFAFRQTYEGLYYQNENTGEYEPRVAESYKVSSDGLVYTFTLRNNVKFHNGDPVKASDVVFSLKRAADNPTVAIRVAAIAGLKELDERTVEITLKAPNAPFMNNLCGVTILSEKVVTEQGDKFGSIPALAGTGPYYWDEVNHAVAWTLKAFPDYYRGEASIKTINFKPIPDASAGLIAFESGDLDWYVAPLANWDNLVNSGKYNTEIVASNHISLFMVNPMANSALKNPLVRKAIAYSIDKEAMSIGGFNGLASTTDFMVPPEKNAGADFKLGVVYDYNPEKAKALLAEAGYPNGVDVGKIMSWTGAYYEKMAQVLYDNLNSIGIKCELLMIEQASVGPLLRTWDYDIVTYGWSYFGDYSYLSTWFHSRNKGANFINFSDPQFDWNNMDRLLDEAAAEMDPAKRASIYKEWNDIFMNTATGIPVLNRVQGFVWDKNLKVLNTPNFYVIYDWSWN